ncbi:MAG: radical SAM/SPASM domain-containing protein [Planctomycetota bacterium]
MSRDRRYREFTFQLIDVFRQDPTFNVRKLTRILESAARGERIVRFEDRYVVSSFVPPIPSRAFITFVSGGVSQDTLFSDLAHARRSAPLSVHLCITSRCSYRCEHCGATYSEGRSELTKAEWIRVIGDLQDIGIAQIVFSGGEPLLRDDLEEIIRSVDDRSSTLMFTNGEGLTPDRARSLKESGLFMLAVSLDSPDPEQHNRIRRSRCAFSHATTAIRNASGAGLYTLVSAVVFKRDLSRENLNRLFWLAKEHGAHEVRIHQPIPRGKLADPEEAQQIFYAREDVSRLYQIQFAANRSTSGCPKVSSFPYTEGPCKFGCGAGLLHSYISATGDLWPCDFVPLSFGNVLEEDPRKLLGQMRQAAGIPRMRCMARGISQHLKGKELPLSTSDSIDVCRACRSRSYPRFFKDLQAP